MREEIIQKILDHKIIVIVRGLSAENLIPLGEAMYKGGIRLIEVTFDSTGKTTDEETGKKIKALVDHFGDRMAIGCGTAIRPEQVEITAKAGGKFIISPDTNVDVIKKTRELGLVSIPAAMTPSEANLAWRTGADFIKLFPASNLGPAYLKAIRAPLSHIRFLATGGVDLNNIADFAKAGSVGFGIGGNIVDKKLIAAGDFDGITALAKQYVDSVAQ